MNLLASIASLGPVLGAVSVASLLGSGHCVGMCGPFAAMASGPARAQGAGHTASPAQAPVNVTLTVKARERMIGRIGVNAAYSLGRLTTYVAMGAVAGALGAALDLGGAALGLQRGALILAGVVMVGIALMASLRLLGVRLPHLSLPAPFVRALQAGHRLAASMRPATRALLIGLLTALLPCGWLYAFVVLAAGTGSPLGGVALMLAFWLGTVPALAAVGLGMQFIAGPLRRRPLVAAMLPIGMAALGIWTLVGRWGVPPLHAVKDADRADVVPAALSSTVDVVDVQAAADEVPPCCRGHASESEP